MYRRSSAIACIVLGIFGCVADEPAVTDPAGAPAADPPLVSPVEAFKQTTAGAVAAALADPALRSRVLDELRQQGSVALAGLPWLPTLAAPAGDAVPEMWLREPDGAPGAAIDSASLIVAYAPTGSEESWTTIPGYTLDGALLALDPRLPPAVPVLVIETHGRLAMRKGIADANDALQRAGLQTVPRVASVTAGRWTTKLTSIRLANDQEPWISGAAEVYAVASGVVGDNAPQLRIVELPYLDNDGTTYTPNQILLDWNDYAFQAANLQLFEHDDNTSYQQLVSALVTAIGAAGSLAGYPVVQAITEIANRVIEAMPAGWFANDDDYVDSFYTIEKTPTYTGLIGASRNATISLQPFFLEANP